MQARVRRSEGARTHAHEHGSTQHVPRSTQRAWWGRRRGDPLHLCFFPPTQFPTEVWWNSDFNPTMGVGVLLEGDDCPSRGLVISFSCIHTTLVVHLELVIVC
eukprot:COSAG03_NODE_1485_length_4000_cov_27.150218_4_plen_103_part_00